jgi:Nucleotidyl transferase AbiEii toxin, Type IV TA system
MVSSPRLSSLQMDLLRAFFAREQRFVLTGGGALAGFHLGHRTSDDLDLFAKPPVSIEEGARAIAAAADAVGGSVVRLRTAPEFQRVLVQRGQESAVVDLVIDRVPDVDVVEQQSGIRLHSRREIAANKVCALLGRGEVRDLVDLRALLATGLELPAVVADAERKDGGVSAATLAWVLDSVRIGSDADVPGVGATELEAFRRDLVVRLRALAKPSN